MKTHVSTILARLDVDSREEAAAEWRHYNSFGGRFRRALQGLTLLWSSKAALAATASAAAIIAAGLAVGLYFALRGDDSEPAATVQAAAASPAQAASQPLTLETPGPQGNLVSWTRGAAIPVGIVPRNIISAFDAIWVANAADGTVSKIDPATEQVVATISVDTDPGHLRAGLGSIWVGNGVGGSISRIDPATNTVVATIPVHSMLPLTDEACWTAVIPGENGVWATDAAGSRLLRFDATNLALLEEHPIRHPRVPRRCPINDVQLIQGYLWVDVMLFGELQIDPATGETVRQWPECGRPTDVNGKMWMLCGKTIVAVDPATGAKGRAIDLAYFGADWDESVVVVGQGSQVWVSGTYSDTRILIYDVETGANQWVPSGPTQGFVLTEDSAWVAQRNEEQVTRFSLRP